MYGIKFISKNIKHKKHHFPEIFGNFEFFDFSLIFRKFHFFENFQKSVLKCFLEMFENIFIRDEKIFRVQIFFCDQVCTYSSPRNYPEHSQAHRGNSERRQPKSSRFFPLYDILSPPTW